MTKMEEVLVTCGISAAQTHTFGTCADCTHCRDLVMLEKLKTFAEVVLIVVL